MDSEWEFEHPGGSFAIEFRADAVNSCACTPSEHSPERQKNLLIRSRHLVCLHRSRVCGVSGTSILAHERHRVRHPDRVHRLGQVWRVRAEDGSQWRKHGGRRKGRSRKLAQGRAPSRPQRTAKETRPRRRVRGMQERMRWVRERLIKLPPLGRKPMCDDRGQRPPAPASQARRCRS